MKITVLGSVNLDLVATAERLPAPGETVTGATLARHPGGKGANQALAARRLGADVALVARVGSDAYADEALALLRAEGVDLTACVADPTAPTGVALIAVAADGENQIVVASGANATLTPDKLHPLSGDALICQLEIPAETIAAVMAFPGFICLNLAPARAVPNALFERADLLVVNDGEAAFYGANLDAVTGLVAITHGATGAMLKRGGKTLASAAPPPVNAIDTTGAGDAFVAALTLALLDSGRTAKHPHRSSRAKSKDALLRGSASLDFARDERSWDVLKVPELEQALRFACAAGAAAAARPGAQPSLPTRAEVEALLK